MNVSTRYLLWPAGKPEEARTAEGPIDAFVIQNAMAIAQLKAMSQGRKIRVVRTDDSFDDAFAIDAALSRSDAMLQRPTLV